MKGIILAGGSGSRLFPSTKVITKQILPVFDKPMIYYPLSTLMLAGIKEILIISTPRDIVFFEQLFGDGSQLGLKFEYAIQEQPNGIAEAFIIGKTFIGESDVCLILGDNIFYGSGLSGILKNSVKINEGASIFGYYVEDPERYGVAEVNSNFEVLSLEEKPTKPKSHYAVTGLYFYNNNVIEIASKLKPSKRGELEITDLNNIYLQQGKLKMQPLGRGFAWLDTGTHESLNEASSFIATIEKRQGLKVACIEEIAFNQGFIDKQQLISLSEDYGSSNYGNYLRRLVSSKN